MSEAGSVGEEAVANTTANGPFYVDRTTLLMERMLLQASLHVRMAAVQRELYVYHIRLAEEHALTNKPHGERTYVIVVDFGQEMNVPAFNSEQPEPVY